MKRVAMFVTNPCTHDARVMKEAATLSENGYEVRVFALANAFNPKGIYPQGGYTVHRLKFNNVFVYAREVVWSFVSLLLKPFRLLKAGLVGLLRSLVSGLLIVSQAILGVPTFILVKLFPSFAHKMRLGIGPHDLDDGGNTRSKKEVLALWLRYFRASSNLFLRARLPYRYRSPVQKKIDRLYRILRMSVFGKFGLRKIYVRTKTTVRRIYSNIRSKSITKVNRLIYKVLLPLHKISTYYYFCKVSSREAEIWGADVAHAHDLNTMYAAYLLKEKFSNIIVVYDSHELWIHRNRVGRKATVEKIIDKVVERALIRHADGIITVCDSIGDWLSERYEGIPAPVILRNMPYQISPKLLSEPSLKERLGIESQSIVMMYTGKITSGRGIEIGIQALTKVEDLNLVLLGYGEENYVEGIRKLISELGLESRVFFCDPVPYQEVTNFISGADFALVYIEPICLSYEFALPNKLFESIQAGIPIMGSGHTEIRNTVESLDVGLCFNNQHDLVKKLNSLEPRQLCQWRDNIEKEKEFLCWEVEQENLLDLYAKIAA